ncbi:hypothetical protein GCM10023115_12170 [Pontixanthobacter gangjinensis]|uniref:DUF429 domain-containing protein n=1 Tax=Pontixanthobacter gangjinensis TaxID=1028742 RepID=A0A6I4SP13_9SPHN|nr:hypothetical protein [Pontixanthobacter gangjinensis]MXO56462.1 hypothetical protein [Pontixanthobacter gangjinensis]
MYPGRFRNFLAVDWSGAIGARQPGIALAMCKAGNYSPTLIHRDKNWSRADVLDFLTYDLPADTLVGLDLGISLPFEDFGSFFPDWPSSPSDARSLWQLIDTICENDPNLEATSLVDHPQLSRYFRRHGGREGDRFHAASAQHKRGRFRVTERAQEAQGCKPYSNFNLVGAAQVGKSSLTGMRVLHKLGGKLPVWPIDPVPDSGSVITEIYTGLAAIEAGRNAGRSKIRNYADLASALKVLGSKFPSESGELDDHSADAILTAAWLRKVAKNPRRWAPKSLTAKIAATEGWTFGTF